MSSAPIACPPISDTFSDASDVHAAATNRTAKQAAEQRGGMERFVG